MRIIVDEEGRALGKFDRAKAEEVYEDLDTNGQGSILLRTAGGRYVIAEVSQWANISTVYLKGTTAAVEEWCAARGWDVPDDLKSGVPSFDLGGRPAIGDAVDVRLTAELREAVDFFAAMKKITRAEAIRVLLRDGLAVRSCPVAD